MPHRNARLTEYARLLAARRVEPDHKPGEVAKQLGVSRQTVRRLKQEGPAGLVDPSSRPRTTPRRTSDEAELRIVAARVEQHAGPRVLAGLLGLPASTIGAVIRRWELPRLAELDRITGEVVRSGGRASDVRYERSRPGELLHVAVDDRTRLAYAEVLPDEKGPTCAAFLHRAATWLRTEHGVRVERVLTDNAKVYRLGKEWTAVCSALQIKRRFIQVRHPWTNGKAERFNRTLQTEWAYARAWTNNTQRTAALTGFLSRYNTRRGHSALGGHPPISRLAA